MRDWGIVRTALFFPIPAAWFATFVAFRQATPRERTFKGLAAVIGCFAAGAFALVLTRTLDLHMAAPLLFVAAYIAGAAASALCYFVLDYIIFGFTRD